VPGFSEPRVLADQFQRNGVILGQRFGVRIGDTCAVSRGAAAGLVASLKSFQQPRRGWSGEKGDPFPRYIDRRPYLTLGTLAAPIYLATPPGLRGRTGQRAMVNHVFVTDHPTAK
jgi:hypothetical protein